MSALSRNPNLLFPLALVAMATPSMGQQATDDDSYQGEAADRYAMVRRLEGEVTIHKGEVEETLTRGTPIEEGDLIESKGRGVLQLGDGTRIAFDGATRFQVAALFKGDQDERQILLRLDYGRIRVSLGGDAQLKVDTPSGTASMKDRAVATVDASRDRTVRVKVSSGRVTFANNRDQVRLSAGDRISAYSSEDRLDRVRSFNTYDQDGFEQWADDSGRSSRSIAYQRVPREIRHYSDDLDDHGDWVQVEDSGWCWRPRVSVEWRPYYRGRWGAYAGGLTWVSDDPFGYVTSHYGRWGWTLNLGWYWIPGVFYSPAWVAWNWSGGYVGWAPLNYWNSPANWGYGAWGGNHCWNVINIHHFHHHNIHRVIHSDVNVLRGFHGNRDLRAPWTRGPVVVTQAEFRNPSQIQRAFDTGIRRDRVQAYERKIQSSTGRVIVRREATPNPVGSGRDQRVPFENRNRDHVRPETAREMDHRVTTPQEERRVTQPRESLKGRSFEVRPNTPQEERQQDSPKGRSHEVRPNTPQEERRQDPPKGRGFEIRTQTPQEERRPDPPRESPREREYRTMEPREERREEKREERRPDPPRERRIEVTPPPPRQEKREERRPDPPKESRPSSHSGSDRTSSRGSDRR